MPGLSWAGVLGGPWRLRQVVHKIAHGLTVRVFAHCVLKIPLSSCCPVEATWIATLIFPGVVVWWSEMRTAREDDSECRNEEEPGRPPHGSMTRDGSSPEPGRL
jgi:hypothetical protein